MSERHPNFNTNKFTAAIITAYYESLRGRAREIDSEDLPDIAAHTEDFVSGIEITIDHIIGQKLVENRKP
jgi:hypothetical protein